MIIPHDSTVTIFQDLNHFVFVLCDWTSSGNGRLPADTNILEMAVPIEHRKCDKLSEEGDSGWKHFCRIDKVIKVSDWSNIDDRNANRQTGDSAA
jgi:hypothetical protein